jgi:hypothetical protein
VDLVDPDSDPEQWLKECSGFKLVVTVLILFKVLDHGDSRRIRCIRDAAFTAPTACTAASGSGGSSQAGEEAV